MRPVFLFDKAVAEVRKFMDIPFPMSGKGPDHQKAIPWITAFGLAFLLAGWEFAVNGYYGAVKLLLLGVLIACTLFAYFELAILTTPYRRFWTMASGLFVALLLFGLYLWACPNLTINPSAVEFGGGDSYTFSITNPSDSVLHSIAVIAK